MTCARLVPVAIYPSKSVRGGNPFCLAWRGEGLSVALLVIMCLFTTKTSVMKIRLKRARFPLKAPVFPMPMRSPCVGYAGLPRAPGRDASATPENSVEI